MPCDGPWSPRITSDTRMRIKVPIRPKPCLQTTAPGEVPSRRRCFNERCRGHSIGGGSPFTSCLAADLVNTSQGAVI